MSGAPRLLAGKRRTLAALLTALALGEAVLAVLFAAALDRLLGDAHPPLLALLSAAGIAAMAAAALLLARWVGEDFAQGFVADCRAALFEAVVREGEGGSDARWLTVLINDMAALRNYALRGTVRLWTSATAAGAAALWVALTMPALRTALVPLGVGAGVIMLLIWPLSRAITAQRKERGRLNRFLVRRVRAELAGAPSAKGHGFRKLSEMSGDLARASVRRAWGAGTMDAAATFAGLAAALVLVWQTIGSPHTAGLAGSLTLLGFIAARLLESARALHARIGGRIALDRLTALVEPDAPPAKQPRKPSGFPFALRLAAPQLLTSLKEPRP
jgi:ABC-type multidrug transport system fused ATPase/permease subunit